MSSSPAWRLTAVAAIGLVAAATPVAAQPAPAAPAPSDAPTGDKKEQARAYVNAGLRAHDQGDYDAAIALYQRAYDLVPHPALFFNMGQSHRLAGRRREALDMYRRYLTEVPTGALADQTRIWIAALESEPANEPPAERGPSEVAPADASPIPSGAPGALTATAEERSSPDDLARPWRIAAGATAGAGLISAAAGSYFGWRARRISNELSEPNAVYFPEKAQEGKSAEKTMFILYGIGGALIAGGAAMYVLGGLGHDEESSATALTPVVGPDRVGLALSGAF